MFTADPRVVPEARLILRLGYGEAQELASAGAGVLHPRCIEPVRAYGIPLLVKDTRRPSLEGTVISDEGEGQAEEAVKAVTLRKRLALVSLESMGMWRQVGFLAQAATLFRTHGISVEHVATSESNITLSFDPIQNGVGEEKLESLVSALSEICEVSVLPNCTAIGVVGSKVRKALPRIAPALAAFEHETLYLMSHAASDVNLTFVVEEHQAPHIVRDLHALLFEELDESRTFGRSWAELTGSEPPPFEEDARWHRRSDELLALVHDLGTPLYVYDGASTEDAAARLQGLPVDRLFYAMKANANEDILRTLEAGGLGFECVSPEEIRHLERIFPDLDP